MRVLLAGGGTAGHLSPGIAIAERLRQRDPEGEVFFACSHKELDARLLSAAGLEPHPLPSAPFPYRPTPQALVASWRLLAATRQAGRLLRKLQPQAVLGIGGYISVPVLLAARRRGLPIAVHVLDAQPDRANRLVSRWARWITLAFAEAAPYFPAARVEVTGCPVRREILEASRPAAQAKFGLDPARLTVLVMGGSQGAQHINQAVVGALPELLSRPVQVLHLTGPRGYEQVLADSGPAAALHGHYFPAPFADDMGPYLAAADVVVGRAGSSSLAEASARGCPQLLIPYPHAGGHQRANAEPLAAAGAAVVLPDEQCDTPHLLHALTALLDDPTKTNAMSRAARRWAAPHAAERLAQGLLALAVGAASSIGGSESAAGGADSVS